MNKKAYSENIKPFLHEGVKSTLIDIGENELSLGDKIINLKLGVSQEKLKSDLKIINEFIEQMELNLELIKQTKNIISEILIEDISQSKKIS